MAFLLNKTFWALYCNMIGKHQETSSVASCIFVCNGLFRVTEISQPKDHLWIFGQQRQLQKWGSFKGGYLLVFSSLHLPSPSSKASSSGSSASCWSLLQKCTWWASRTRIFQNTEIVNASEPSCMLVHLFLHWMSKVVGLIWIPWKTKPTPEEF